VTFGSSFAPRSLEGQMIAVLALSLVVLFALLMILEVIGHEDALEAARSDSTLSRLSTMKPLLESVSTEQLSHLLDATSLCHSGYTVTDQPYPTGRHNTETDTLAAQISRALRLDANHVQVGHATLSWDDFSYRRCRVTEIDLPIDAIVISVMLAPGRWFNTEVHPHEWHFREKTEWMLRYTGAFVFVGGIAVCFMRRLGKPLNSLAGATLRFAQGLKVEDVDEAGPPDVRRAIGAFNAMQKQVSEEVERRANTLASISHDVRTPLTALRIKAELVEDEGARHDLITSIEKMERVTESALEFLRGESRAEAMRNVDLSALLESECSDFEEIGSNVAFYGSYGVRCCCRPGALLRAVRNLIENAVKYGSSAKVEVRNCQRFIDIVVSDNGPGIPEQKMEIAARPFERLSKARESDQGGFGLGLSIVEAVARGHDGELLLGSNEPTGLIATIRLPAAME
jgi:signal transduction histidine kinase